jgi:2-iminobutanoate/2-iminopropanoate deaminase
MTQRRSINIPGFAHKNPIPAASRVGNVVMSGVINGIDPATGEPGETLARQCELMFQHVTALVTQAGGHPDRIVKLTVWMADRSQRQALNAAWCAAFPDPESRPARHTLQAAMDGKLLVQCDFTAVL